MRIVPILCLSDNYAYLVVCDETKQAAIVDPSEAEPVARALEGTGPRSSFAPTAIWCTHHHHDHTGGNEEIARRFGIAAVFGHESDRGRIPGQTRYLKDGDTFELGALSVRAIHVPGHTKGAVAYVVSREPSDPAVFTGDTLFLGGCGRLFEGTAADMHRSLSKLAALEPRTRVYCGHEYTEYNLRFAHHVEPSNEHVARARERAARLRAEGKPTVPQTIAEELLYNPFLRTASSEIRQTLGIPGDASDLAAFGVIRKAKDGF